MDRKKILICCAALALALILPLSSCSGDVSGKAKDAAGDSGQKNGAGTTSVNVEGNADSAGTENENQSDFTADAQGADVQHAEGQGAAAAGSGVIEISEKMFVGQMNDIYLNPDDYLGRTISYEGFFTYFDNEETGQRYNCVVRNGPGCCGYDSSVGFEIDWGGDLPEMDDWCAVEGVVDTYVEDGMDYIIVRAKELEVLPYRGLDTVTQ
jgi:uncharacterized membrane protein YcgQ (UPF0703/DUF1980 family)